jgi:hypothetical protein
MICFRLPKTQMLRYGRPHCLFRVRRCFNSTTTRKVYEQPNSLHITDFSPTLLLLSPMLLLISARHSFDADRLTLSLPAFLLHGPTLPVLILFLPSPLHSLAFLPCLHGAPSSSMHAPPSWRASVKDAPASRRGDKLRVTPPSRRAPRHCELHAPPPTSVPALSSAMRSLHSSKQQSDIELKVHVTSICFKCYRCFI